MGWQLTLTACAKQLTSMGGYIFGCAASVSLRDERLSLGYGEQSILPVGTPRLPVTFQTISVRHASR